MLLKDIISKGTETVSMLYPQGEAKEMVFAYIEDVFGYKRHAHVLHPDLELSGSQTAKAMADFARMASGEPLQYVTGKAFFYGREFKVDQNVLIPRQETEILCQEVLRSVHGSQPHCRILDLCTGSGCIAWTLSLEMPGSVVQAVDISPGALSVASSQDFEEEVTRAGALKPDFIMADVLKGPHEGIFKNAQFDIIVSNPPYVMDSEKVLMRANVLEHEPHLALFVPDTDPLKFYKAVAVWVSALLSPEGFAVVEINEALGKVTADVFVEAGFTDVQIIKDLHEKDRFVRFSRG